MSDKQEMLMFKVIDALMKGKSPNKDALMLLDHEFIDLLNVMQNKFGYLQNLVFLTDEMTGIELFPILSSMTFTAMGMIFHQEYTSKNS